MLNLTTRGKAFFITGTDTDCGKTLVSSALLCAFAQRGLRVIGMKPVASGSEIEAGCLVNRDVVALQTYANVALPNDIINPYIFQPAISPHFAAAESGVAITLERIENSFRQCCQAADIVIVEGAGGWRVPLGPNFFISDLAKALNLPVIIVSGLTLGCINHTLLSAEAICNDQLELVGWVANAVDPHYANIRQTVETLQQQLQAPLLAHFDWQIDPNPEKLAALLDVEPLLALPRLGIG